MRFAADSSLPGSSPLPVLEQSASMSGQVVGATQSGWHVEFCFKLDSLPSTEQTFAELGVAGGAIATVRASVGGGVIRVRVLDADGNSLAFISRSDQEALSAFTGRWNRCVLYTLVDGDGAHYGLRWLDVIEGSWYSIRTVYGADPGKLRRIRAAWGQDFSGMAIGHLAAWDQGFDANGNPAISAFVSADDGYSGQVATNRLRDVCQEQGVIMSALGADAYAEPMGPRLPDTALSILQSCEDADGGILSEKLHAPALQYRYRRARYDQPVRLQLDYSAGHIAPPLDPVDDDQAVVNDITVTRVGGSSSRAVLESGLLSVQPPPDGVGVYDSERTVNVFADSQLYDIAGWDLHLGTYDGYRYPIVRLNMANSAMEPLRETVMTLQVGDRIQIANPPAWLPPETIDLIVLGYTMTLNAFTWEYELNCVPAGSWAVGHVGADDPADDDYPVRLDTEGSELSAAAGPTDTVLFVRTTSGPAWVTSDGPDPSAEPGDFPFDITVGGETIRVTSNDPVFWDDFGRTVTGGWGTSASGWDWFTSGGNASDYAVSGGSATISLATTPTALRATLGEVFDPEPEILTRVSLGTVATGASLMPGLLMRVSGSNYYLVRAVQTPGGALYVEAVDSGTTIAAGYTGYTMTAGNALWIRARVVGQTIYGRAWVDGIAEPYHWHVQAAASGVVTNGLFGCYASAASGNTNTSPVFTFTTFKQTNHHSMHVIRSINGISKSHDIGASVSLAHPLILAR